MKTGYGARAPTNFAWMVQAPSGCEFPSISSWRIVELRVFCCVPGCGTTFRDLLFTGRHPYILIFALFRALFHARFKGRRQKPLLNIKQTPQNTALDKVRGSFGRAGTVLIFLLVVFVPIFLLVITTLTMDLSAKGRGGVRHSSGQFLQRFAKQRNDPGINLPRSGVQKIGNMQYQSRLVHDKQEKVTQSKVAHGVLLRI